MRTHRRFGAAAGILDVCQFLDPGVDVGALVVPPEQVPELEQAAQLGDRQALAAGALDRAPQAGLGLRGRTDDLYLTAVVQELRQVLGGAKGSSSIITAWIRIHIKTNLS